MIDVAGFEEKFARFINDRLVRQHVSHQARGYLPNAWADVIVLTHISAGSKCQLGDAELVPAVEIIEEARDVGLELDLRDEPLGIDLHWNSLRDRASRLREQGHNRQDCEST